MTLRFVVIASAVIVVATFAAVVTAALASPRSRLIRRLSRALPPPPPAKTTIRLWHPQVYRQALHSSGSPMTEIELQQYSARYKGTGRLPQGIPMAGHSVPEWPDWRYFEREPRHA